MEWLLVVVVGMGFVWLLLGRPVWVSMRLAREELENGALLVDVRTPAEYQTSKIPGSINIPIGEFTQAIATNDWPDSREMLLYCATGTRSAIAVRLLKSRGFTNVWNLGTVGRARRLLETR